VPRKPGFGVGFGGRIPIATVVHRARAAYLRLLTRDERGREYPLVMIAGARRDLERALEVEARALVSAAAH
jgi:hypothetical protein